MLRAALSGEAGKHPARVAVVHRLPLGRIERPSSLMIPPLLGDSEFLAVLPGLLADACMRQGPFASLKLPFALAPTTIRIHGHRRFNADAGHRWLRQLVARAVTVTDAP